MLVSVPLLQRVGSVTESEKPPRTAEAFKNKFKERKRRQKIEPFKDSRSPYEFVEGRLPPRGRLATSDSRSPYEVTTDKSPKLERHEGHIPERSSKCSAILPA